MTRPLSLHARLGLSLGLALTLLWIAAASVTAVVVRREMDAVFDAALQETAQRLLPLAVLDIIGREEDAVTQRLGAIRAHDEFFTYLVRDAKGRILLQSHATDPAAFPEYDGPGFRDTATHRFYNEEALRGSVRITVAEPLDHRRAVARQVQMSLGLPLVVVVPAALLAMLVAVRASLAALDRFGARLTARGPHDLSPLPPDGLPAELLPMAETVNGLLGRLQGAFEAERSFAANVAHELRTPLAGAIAQAQRIRAEARTGGGTGSGTGGVTGSVTEAGYGTGGSTCAARAGEIEVTLKRLTRFCERLLQLARAEGGRLRLGHVADLGPVARLVVDELARGAAPGRVTLSLPDRPVLSDLDPDAFAILCRNLVENALRHGGGDAPVEVTLGRDGTLTVANAGPVVPPAVLAGLTARFERGGRTTDGSGLGLAIVAAIAERIGSRLILVSPRPGHTDGFEASIRLPAAADAAPAG